MRWNSNNYFYHKNHLGSVTSLTNSSGSTVQTYQYEAFGKIRSITGSLTYNPLTYTARERHVASGLYYYRARWYDPQLGRFMTQDPIGLLGGPNLYAYVGGNPLNWRDPYGLCIEKAIDWMMNEFVVPGPYGSPSPDDWGDWVSLPYEAGKFGEGWEDAEWGLIGTATA
ncbi:MAG: RHS repeat-associated core domain-containing protein, partial [Candidatus Abyssobacteria bacterium SURF_17]